jgi:hypothetical protein
LSRVCDCRAGDGGSDGSAQLQAGGSKISDGA